MRQRADVKCYHCGDVSGTWEWPAHTAPAVGAFHSSSSRQWLIVPLAQLRCGRCQGPVYLDDFVTVAQQQAIVLERPRRGRPRKLPRLAS